MKLPILTSAAIALLCFPFSMCGQGVQSPPSLEPEAVVNDGGYLKIDSEFKHYIQYPHIRQADVMYKRRIWQEIDLRQKFNHPFYYPLRPIQDRKNLWDVIKEGVLQGEITAYSVQGVGTNSQNDEFTIPLTRDEAWDIIAPPDSVDGYDETTKKYVTKYENVDLESKKIIKYQIKEEWIWDRQRSERVCRIIGIAPILEYEDDGEIKEKRLFWVYFDQCRPLFAKHEVYNMFNDAQRRTYDDLFQKRYFSSYIIKEDNVYDRNISEYAFGVNAIAESERIQGVLFRMEHDMWQY